MQVERILKIKGGNVIAVEPETPVARAVSIMVERDIGSVVVMRAGIMLGMLTFREVLAGLNRQAGNLDGLTVANLMVANPETATPDTTVDELRRRMLESHTRYVPVVQDGQLIGVVSFHDVAKAVLEAQSFENRLLKDYIKNWPEQG